MPRPELVEVMVVMEMEDAEKSEELREVPASDILDKFQKVEPINTTVLVVGLTSLLRL